MRKVSLKYINSYYDQLDGSDFWSSYEGAVAKSVDAQIDRNIKFYGDEYLRYFHPNLLKIVKINEKEKNRRFASK